MSTICDDLRTAILQAAMQGKLTQRLSSDDSAESNITKHANVDFTTDDNYPEEWRFVTFGDIAEMGMGKTILKADMKANGIPVYSATISDKHLGYIDNPTLILKRGNIVIPARGNSIGWATLVKEDKATCTQTTIYCKNIKDFIRPKFLWTCCYAFKDAWFKYEGSAIPQITVTTIRKHLVPIPSLSEQDRIIEKVDALVDRITDLEQSADALASLKKAFPDDIKASLLQAAMQGKLTKQLPEDGSAEDLLKEIKAEKEKLIAKGKVKKQKPLAPITDDEIPFSIPDNWKWVRLGEIGDWGSGATPPKTRPEYYKDGNIKWLLTGDLNNGLITDTTGRITELALEKTSVRLNPIGSVLIAMYGATIGKLGVLDVEATTNQACCACVPYDGIYNWYLFYFLMQHKAAFIGEGAGAAQPNISKEKIIATIMPLPPLAEQKRIVERLNTLMQNINVVGDLIASE